MGRYIEQIRGVLEYNFLQFIYPMSQMSTMLITLLEAVKCVSFRFKICVLCGVR